MKIFQLIDLIIRLFRLNKKSKVVLLFLIPTFLVGQNNAAFWLGKRPSGAAPVNLLLDDYPGAAAAYSLRKLDKDYTGFAVEVRRQSDNATQDIGFVGNDLNTVAIISFCGDSNCYVSTLYDQSGNGNNCTQLTTTKQPLIYIAGSGVVTQDTKPAIQFDGTDDILTTDNNYAYGSVISMVSVANILTNKNYSRVLSTTTDIYAFLGTAASPFYIASFFGNGSTWGTIAAQSITTWVQQRLVISIAESTNYLYIDNNSGITRSNPMGSYTGKFDIGGSTGTPAQASNSNIQEIIIYPNTQRSNITGIKSHINTYYSIY